MSVVIVDSGGANITSVQHALQRLGVNARWTANANEIASAGHVLLPGVGAASIGMERLRTAGLVECIRNLTQPVLGICLGMQLLFESSAEDHCQCLNIIPGRIQAFAPSAQYPAPHMGWSKVNPATDEALFEGIEPDTYFYFVHGFHAPVTDACVARAQYGQSFAAAVRRDNFWGVQFHPERSSADGRRVLQNFLTNL